MKRTTCYRSELLKHNVLSYYVRTIKYPFVCKSGFGVWIAVGVSEKDGGTGACVSETY